MSLLNTLIPSLTRTPARRERSESMDFGQTVQPAFEIKETTDAWGVTAALPGVSKDGLEITAEEGHIRILGRRQWKQPEGWALLYRESTDAPYELILNHDNVIDVDKIAAELREGVLRLSLPKKEAIKPRQIAVS